SRGLEAEDRGDFAAAAQAFQQATRLDPGFRAAAEHAATSQAAEASVGVPASDLAVAIGGGAGAGPLPGAAGPGTLLNAINGAVPTGTITLQAVASTSTIVDATASSSNSATTTIVLPPTDPNRLCEGAACDGPARVSLVGTVIIILKRP
ncbi:MAG TPA: hypothetical protein VF976_06320, partial [Gemmatimonadales bacterium]